MMAEAFCGAIKQRQEAMPMAKGENDRYFAAEIVGQF